VLTGEDFINDYVRPGFALRVYAGREKMRWPLDRGYKYLAVTAIITRVNEGYWKARWDWAVAIGIVRPK
jgi:hypothetical protein